MLFFFSYPRAVNDEYLRRFFNDLHEAVRLLVGAPEGERVGFFDQDDIERGDEWPVELEEALQSCGSFVAIYSPAYFRGGWCERELRAFEARARALDGIGNRASIKPVVWIPAEVPQRFSHLQFRRGDPQSAENKKGLRWVARLQNDASLQRAYIDFIDILADEIVRANGAALPRLNAISDVLRASPPVDVTLAPSTTRHLGPTHVEFVYIVGARGELAGLRQNVDFYGETIPREWRPFLPEDPRFIGPLAQSIAGSENFTSAELVVTPLLYEAIRAAESRRNLVVVFVDGWTVLVPRHHGVLSSVDELNYRNCAFLVPWNARDLESVRQRERLTAAVGQALSRWARHPAYLRNANSVDEFARELRDTLARLKAEVLNTADARPIPILPRPVVTNVLEHRR